MDKTEKKARRKALRSAQRAAARERFPLPEARLRELFDTLDVELGQASCDHTRRFVEAWLDRNRIRKRPVLDWLDANGGFCDCEVLANVEQVFEEALGK